MPGGYSGETFGVQAYGERAVVRIYGRDPSRAPVDAALMRLVRGLVPVPTVLDVRLPKDQPPMVVTSYVAGERLALVLPGSEPPLRSRLARSVGDVLATLSGIPFLRAGSFVDANLQLSDTLGPGDGLVGWLDAHPLPGWESQQLRALSEVCAEADVLLDAIDRACLVHSDFNLKNLLVDPMTGAVTALVDWEFAHSGSPYADLGNLVRFERGTDWASEVVERFVARAPGVLAEPLPLAYASDLWALIDLAARTTRHDVVVRADALLRAIARSGRLDATTP